MTPQSIEWVERFFVAKLWGKGSVAELPAKQADALLMLEKEWRETGNGVQ